MGKGIKYASWRSRRHGETRHGTAIGCHEKVIIVYKITDTKSCLFEVVFAKKNSIA